MSCVGVMCLFRRVHQSTHTHTRVLHTKPLWWREVMVIKLFKQWAVKEGKVLVSSFISILTVSPFDTIPQSCCPLVPILHDYFPLLLQSTDGCVTECLFVFFVEICSMDDDSFSVWAPLLVFLNKVKCICDN